ncbi:MAG: flagellar biosynthetic protein FliR [Bacillota bacterium]
MGAGILSNNSIYLFVLIMIRYIGMMLITPIFSSQVIINRVKIILAVSLAVLTYPILQQMYQIEFNLNPILLIINIMSEISVGLFMGFAVFLIFSAVQMAGQFIDMQMGFRIANVVDPFTGANSPVIGQFKNILITLVFLAVNGHLFLIRQLFSSFEIIPPGQINFGVEIWQYFFRRSADMFVLSVKMALPIVGAVFVIDIILAFLARAVPQMNLFIVGLPVKIMAGLVLLFLLLGVLTHFYNQIIMDIIYEIGDLFKLLAPE